MFALFASMFVLGLVTSVHCVGMCGPMVVTYAVKGEEGQTWQDKVVPNASYQAAKLASYLLVGLVMGAVGSAFNVNAIRPWTLLVAGVFMIVLGLGMTGRFPWAARLTPRPPKALVDALSRLRRRATREAGQGDVSLATPVACGLLTGLMPCAPLQTAELGAVAAGSAGGVLAGGLAMLAFGLGTTPLLFAFGTASSFLPKDLRHRLSLVLAVLVIVFGVVFLGRAALLGGVSTSWTGVSSALVGSPATPARSSTAADGVVEVPLKIVNTQYVPSTVLIPIGRPVRLIVDRQEDTPCSNRLVIRQLGVDVPLADNGVTKVTLPASAAGAYAMTCGMGMMSGQVVAGDSSSAGGRLPVAWLVAALAALFGGAVWAWRRSKGKALKVGKTRGA